MESRKPHPPIFSCLFPNKKGKQHQELTTDDVPNSKEVFLFRGSYDRSGRIFYGYRWADSHVELKAPYQGNKIDDIEELSVEVFSLVAWHPGIFPEKPRDLRPRFVSDSNWTWHKEAGHVAHVGWPATTYSGLSTVEHLEFYGHFLLLADKKGGSGA